MPLTIIWGLNWLQIIKKNGHKWIFWPPKHKKKSLLPGDLVNKKNQDGAAQRAEGWTFGQVFIDTQGVLYAIFLKI